MKTNYSIHLLYKSLRLLGITGNLSGEGSPHRLPLRSRRPQPPSNGHSDPAGHLNHLLSPLSLESPTSPFSDLGGSPRPKIFRAAITLGAGPRGLAFLKPGTVARSHFYCKRCLSPNHLAAACVNRIKCWRCNQEGHISRGYATFHGLQKFMT